MRRGFLFFASCYTDCVQAVNLSYKLKLYPTQNKADTLALLVALFQRAHAACTTAIAQGEGHRLPRTQGLGEFVGRAYRRAYIDYQRCQAATAAVNRPLLAARKTAWAYAAKLEQQKRTVTAVQTQKLAALLTAANGPEQPFAPPHLKAELIDSAEVQEPRKARGFDCWIMLRGTTASRGRNGGFYIPARTHRAIKRTLALPGARLNESAEVFRKNGKWYARVSVSVPRAEVQEPKGWLGCDVGVRGAVIRSDGYPGRSLKPVVDGPNRHKRKRQRQRRRYARSFQRQIIAREARKAVLVALATGRGISLEDPRHLPRWGGWAARQFAKRVELLARVGGVAVRLLKAAWSSQSCSRCSSRDTFRRKEMFRCLACGFTRHADENAALNLSSGSYAGTGVSHGSLSLLPGGGADE